jgi:ribosomal protein S18 acetylase RimI-like enzyme
MIEVFEANDTHIQIICQIAEKTWAATYKTILSANQMRYMLETLYAPPELNRLMNNGSQIFLILKDNHGYQGFASFGKRDNDPSIYKLHKLYVLPENHGKGYGRMLIEDVKKRVAGEGITTLDLNVNRYNPAKSFYEKLGFKIIREEDVPIGQYWMNDYVMRLKF